MLEGIYSRIFPARIFQRGKLKKNVDMKDVLIIALPMLLSMSFDTLLTFVDWLFLS